MASGNSCGTRHNISEHGEAAPPAKRRKGGKQYIGCTTCRQRKIKCDQRRPKCLNCEKSRQYLCGGYDISSTSLDASSPENVFPLLGRDVGPSVPSSFDFNQTGGEDGWQTQDEIAYGTHDCHRPVQARNPATSDYDTTVQEYLSGALPHAADVINAAFTVDASLLWDEDWNDQSVMDGLSATISPTLAQTSDADSPSSSSSSADSGFDNTRSDARSNHGCSTVSRPLDTLAGFSNIVRQLLYHYQTHVCQLMMPTTAPSQNPWLNLYLPMAILGNRSPAKQALLHSILAVSAFNQTFLRKLDPKVFRAQALEHSAKAEELMKTLDLSHSTVEDDSQDASDKHSMLAAILTMTTVEVFNGNTDGKCHQHLRRAQKIIERTGGIHWWLSRPQSTILLQIFRCLRIVSDTSDWMDNQKTVESRSVPQTADPNTSLCESTRSQIYGNEDIIGKIYESCEYTLDVSFGISMRTLWCLNKTIELTKVKKQGGQWWQKHTNDLLRLEESLFDTMKNPEAFSEDITLPQVRGHHAMLGIAEPCTPPQGNSGSHIPEAVAQEIRENHLWAFHYSVALFYRRAICGGGDNVSSPAHNLGTDPTLQPSGQDLVSKVLDHLENIDALTIGVSVANTLWPALICAVEAVDTALRHRVLVHFSRAKRHGINNIHVAKSLVLEVWRRVDRQAYHRSQTADVQLGPIDWRDVMREKKMWIMLT